MAWFFHWLTIRIHKYMRHIKQTNPLCTDLPKYLDTAKQWQKWWRNWNSNHWRWSVKEQHSFQPDLSDPQVTCHSHKEESTVQHFYKFSHSLCGWNSPVKFPLRASHHHRVEGQVSKGQSMGAVRRILNAASEDGGQVSAALIIPVAQPPWTYLSIE